MSNATSESTRINVSFNSSAGFVEFLLTLKCSLVISTYQTGNLFFIGTDQSAALKINPITLKRPMGLWSAGESLYVADRQQIYRFNNVVPAGQSHEGHDKIFIPQVSWTTGDMDVHDIALDKAGRLLFVNTLFSCIAAVSEENSFKKIWIPPNISTLLAEDRCHINGLALKNGELSFATAFSKSDKKEGWREKKQSEGLIWDIKTNKELVTGLTMPHSPRWYAERLWFLESGTGVVAFIDSANGNLVKFAELPGYLRGLTFYGEYVFVASSRPRKNSAIQDESLSKKLTSKGVDHTCGIFVLELKTGKLIHRIKMSEDVQELYDIAILPNCLNPRAYSMESEEVRYILNIG